MKEQKRQPLKACLVILYPESKLIDKGANTMQANRGSEICSEFANWLNEWPFTAFLTLSVPYGLRGHRTITTTQETRLEKYFTSFGKATNAEIGALGVFSLSHFGLLHAHVVALKEDGGRFGESDLARLKRAWPHNSDAREIYDLPPLLDYISSEKHILNSRMWEPIICGANALKKTQHRFRANSL